MAQAIIRKGRVRQQAIIDGIRAGEAFVDRLHDVGILPGHPHNTAHIETDGPEGGLLLLRFMLLRHIERFGDVDSGPGHAEWQSIYAVYFAVCFDRALAIPTTPVRQRHDAHPAHQAANRRNARAPSSHHRAARAIMARDHRGPDDTCLAGSRGHTASGYSVGQCAGY